MGIWTRLLPARLLFALLILLSAGQPAPALAAGLPQVSAERGTVWLPLVIGPPPNGEMFAIGESVAGRPLEVYRYGLGPRKRLILGGIHGGYEWNTVDLVRMLMEQVDQNPGLLPPDLTLYFLPVLNPDGLARDRWIWGRANHNNADINRNFGYNWKSSWYNVGCWDYYYPQVGITAGDYPFSEPEAAALRDFVLDYAVEALISYHSRGAEIYAGGPASSGGPDPASLDLALTLEDASGYAYPPHFSDCEMTGQMIDWASSRGIAAVDVELTEHQSIDNDVEPNLRILEAFLRWELPEE